ncbi:MAG: asparagine synthase B [Eubacterium sp.]|nr:asparagine synthase B [Eubacterium sp.]
MCSIMGYAGTDLTEQQFKEALAQTTSRGPDDTRVIRTENGGFLGFNRLSIMGLTSSGMQPFTKGKNAVVCNGEIYGFRPIRTLLEEEGYRFESDSDCEILLPLYARYGTDMLRHLDAEFALILYDGSSDTLLAARDPVGIRPLYYGYTRGGSIVFASEPKNLTEICGRIMPFPPGHYYKNGQFICYRDMSDVSAKTSVFAPADPYTHDPMPVLLKNIHDKLVSGVTKRLDADAPVGYLLSGGLDSSLVCGIAAKYSDKPLRTFAIGMDKDAIDLKYAREVADYIHSDHTEVIMTTEDVLAALEPVVKALATYDITTIRASIGMYLVCKYIHEHTDIRVLLTGEISDELFGYKYTDFAPDAAAFQTEAEKRIREIHMYDVLRADRCISVHSLEARVPFGDLDFVDYVMHIDPARKLNSYGIGKYLLREAFADDPVIPESIRLREKAAFSDAVGHSMRDDLQAYAETLYSDREFHARCRKYFHAVPFTKESLLYRELFEKYYPDQSEMVTDFWMPNKSWKGCNVNDPSARVLSNYGASGV